MRARKGRRADDPADEAPADDVAAPPGGRPCSPPARGTRPLPTEHPDLLRLSRRPRSALADTVGWVFDPLVLVAAVSLLVGIEAAGVAGALWALLALVFCAALPELTLRLMVATGRAPDRALVVREHRAGPLAVAIGSVLLGMVLLALLGAPAPVTALVVTVLAGLAVMTTVTRWFKVSFHTDVAATAAVVLAVTFGPVTLTVTGPIVMAVAWARWRAGRHSPAQILLGLLLGIAVSGVLFPALR